MDNKRTTMISLRLTEQEQEQLKELAYQARMTISAYIRAQLFDKGTKEDVRELYK